MQTHKHSFLLRDGITFLNFGSFGATPRAIYEEWQRYQLELEAEPVQFIVNRGPQWLKESREALGAYIGCDADDVVYVPNPTYAVNMIARNIGLEPGDEILGTDLEYGAMDRTWKFYGTESGYRFIRQHISLPLISKEKFIEDFWQGLTKKTKAIFISHITSSTALIFPVKEICDRARELGLITIVDGAHVPGHIPLNLNDLNPDFYTGACHKWMMTPKGSSFLYVTKAWQDRMDPLVVSWGYESVSPSHSTFLDYHQFNGTRDFSAYLTIPKAIQFMNEHHWESVSLSCKNLVLEQAPRVADLLGSELLAPLTTEFFGQMCSLPIRTASPDQLKSTLYDRFRIEIPVMVHDGKVYLRYSIQAFNDVTDFDRLYDALSEMQNEGLIL